MSKVFIVNENYQYVEMYQKQGWTVVASIEDADLVQFTGGEDVSPNYYGEHKHPATHNNPQRDAMEVSVYQKCVDLNKPMVGICRGGQFLHVMCGGDLWQDVRGHAIYGTHGAVSIDSGAVIEVTSTHHQMMRHTAGELVLQGNHNPCKYKAHMNGRQVEVLVDDVDVEAVYHADANCFCFQPHPEFDDMEGQPCRDYYFQKIDQYFGLGA